MVSQELLGILRCPSCVSQGPDAGRLDRAGNWLVCRDCERAYPIRDDIPVMLIEEGDRYRGVPPSELPEVPPAEVPAPAAMEPAKVGGLSEEQTLFMALIGLLVGLGLVLFLVSRAKKKRS